jgi:DNA-binding XRE family transcriptional regulator
MRWYDCWKAFVGMKRHYPDTGTYTTTDGTVTIWCPSVQQSAAALPRNLKRLREAKGWSVAKLSRESYVHGSTIMSIEVGDMAGSQRYHDPKLSTCLKLARAMECGVEALVEEREK